ncbi:MAG: hypothetical protein HQK83_15615, partial [Fibrobacteria bacterium]|nr:hypothetical protein [Fibrobacteria bacterium]
ELTEEDVIQSLRDGLGNNWDKYEDFTWHELFQEDTSQGTSHRILVCLDKKNTVMTNLKADLRIPVEIAIIALASSVQEELGTPHLQFVLPYKDSVYSVMFTANSYYHILKCDHDIPEGIVARLKKHALYAKSENANIKTLTLYLCSIPGGVKLEELSDSSLWKPTIDSSKITHALTVPGENNHVDEEALLQLGLALTKGNSELQRHNKATYQEMTALTLIRNRSTSFKVTFASLALAACISLVFCWGLFTGNKTLAEIQKQVNSHQVVLSQIDKLRSQKNLLVDSLYDMKPLWYNRVNWPILFTDIQKALPAKSGLEGIVIEEKTSGTLSLQFKAWVNDWKEITQLLDKLKESSLIAGVTLSEQRKNNVGKIFFHISCTIERF